MRARRSWLWEDALDDLQHLRCVVAREAAVDHIISPLADCIDATHQLSDITL